MRSRRDERAASALELSIIAPVFLLLIFGIIEVGLYMYANNVVTLAAREGASYLRVSSATGDSAGWEAAARDTALAYADQAGMLTSAWVPTAAIDEAAGTATVEVCGTYSHPISFIEDPDVCQSVTVVIEQFEPDPGVPEV